MYITSQTSLIRNKMQSCSRVHDITDVNAKTYRSQLRHSFPLPPKKKTTTKKHLTIGMPFWTTGC